VNAIHTRDGGKCCGCGGHARSVQHRIHGNRSDNRPSNLLSFCGDGVTGCHGYAEHHRAEARLWGWEVSKHRRGDTTTAKAWMENGPYGRGFYLLDDDGGLRLVEPSNEEGPLARAPWGPRGARR
jgi:hypothetical protein